MMALYFSSEFFGYLIPVPLVPKIDAASEPVYYYAAAGIFFFLALLDYKIFILFPLQANICVD